MFLISTELAPIVCKTQPFRFFGKNSKCFEKMSLLIPAIRVGTARRFDEGFRFFVFGANIPLRFLKRFSSVLFCKRERLLLEARE